MNDRVVRILDILSSNKSVKVNLLAEILDVTQATLRKDLDKLEKKRHDTPFSRIRKSGRRGRYR